MIVLRRLRRSNRMSVAQFAAAHRLHRTQVVMRSGVRRVGLIVRRCLRHFRGLAIQRSRPTATPRGARFFRERMKAGDSWEREDGKGRADYTKQHRTDDAKFNKGGAVEGFSFFHGWDVLVRRSARSSRNPRSEAFCWESVKTYYRFLRKCKRTIPALFRDKFCRQRVGSANEALSRLHFRHGHQRFSLRAADSAIDRRCRVTVAGHHL